MSSGNGELASGPTGTYSRQNTDCAICLDAARPGGGQALLTAACGHMFHLTCGLESLRKGHRTCPLCRAPWKDMEALLAPRSQAPSTPPPQPPIPVQQFTGQGTIPGSQISPRRFAVSEIPEYIYNDDSPLQAWQPPLEQQPTGVITLSVVPEFSSVRCKEGDTRLLGLVHVAAPAVSAQQRVPVDLVAVLDASGSMAGTKIALVQQTMRFVVSQLGPGDRLSLVKFSSGCERLTPLLSISAANGPEFENAIQRLNVFGGTNIGAGLSLGLKVLKDRRHKNPVASILLLSDGCDGPHQFSGPAAEAGLLGIPVHTFGYGQDHDESAMNSISNASSGSFTFIESNEHVQVGVAQCVGGLLSVAAQNTVVRLRTGAPGVKILRFLTTYPNQSSEDQRSGVVQLGNVYAEEQRDLLVEVQLPQEEAEVKGQHVFTVTCDYESPQSQEMVRTAEVTLLVDRTLEGVQSQPSLEVDRHRNRVLAAEALLAARAAGGAERLSDAREILACAAQQITASLSAKDPLCQSLLSDLHECSTLFRDHATYVTVGSKWSVARGSSHSQQRETKADNRQSSTLYLSSNMANLRSLTTPATTLSSTQNKVAPSAFAPLPEDAADSFVDWDKNGHEEEPVGQDKKVPSSPNAEGGFWGWLLLFFCPKLEG